jgi:hypothetical protein
MKFINFFRCLRVIFDLLDPDPDRESRSGYGYRDSIKSGSGSTALLRGFDVFVGEGKDGVERVGERHELGLQLQVLLRPISGRRGMAALLLLLYFKYSWQLGLFKKIIKIRVQLFLSKIFFSCSVKAACYGHIKLGSSWLKIKNQPAILV